MESIPVLRPLAATDVHLYLDKGYDGKWLRWAITFWGMTPHIRSRGEERKRDTDKPARRWVVERSHGWMNCSRRILIRWEKKVRNYDAFLHLNCAIVIFNRLITG